MADWNTQRLAHLLSQQQQPQESDWRKAKLAREMVHIPYKPTSAMQAIGDYARRVGEGHYIKEGSKRYLNALSGLSKKAGEIDKSISQREFPTPFHKAAEVLKLAYSQPVTTEENDLIADMMPGGIALRVKGSGLAHDFLNFLRNKYPKIEADITEDARGIVLNKLVVPKEIRNMGVGSEFMEDLTKYADLRNQPIALTAAGDYGGSKAGQVKFYSKFGFKPNKGKNADFSFMEGMIRQNRK